jgi:arginine deiminase
MTEINVTSEITKLKKLLIHSPGGEMNNMLPNKREEWLIDDILETGLIQKEYNEFAKILLLFLDPDKFLEKISMNPSDSNFHKSEVVIDAQYKLAQLFADIKNEKKSLALIEQVAALEKLHFKRKVDLIKLYEEAKKEFEQNNKLIGSKFMSLVKTLITGKLEWKWNGKIEELPKDKSAYIFKPIPNFIFTRDIGVTINDHFLITKTANEIRHREVILMKYIAECFLFKTADDEDEYKEVLDKVIEISEDDDYFQYDEKEMEKMKVNFEGGDIMMVSPKHLLIGRSQRTSIYAINKLIHRIFKKNIGIELISVIQIAEKRSQMHIDTIMTHVKANVWMLYGRLSKKIMDEEFEHDNIPFSHREIIEEKGATKRSTQNEFVNILQFYCEKGNYPTGAKETARADFFLYGEEELKGLNLSSEEFETKMTYEKLPTELKYSKPNDLESLLTQISKIEYKDYFNGEVEFVYSGGKQYPFDEREQWTDACNLLCLGNGVVIGYDRNKKTAEAFEKVMTKTNGEAVPESNQKLFDAMYKEKEEKGEEVMMYCISANNLFKYIYSNCKSQEEMTAFTSDLKDLLITISSGELSRARGGSHCMSMPLLREK